MPAPGASVPAHRLATTGSGRRGSDRTGARAGQPDRPRCRLAHGRAARLLPGGGRTSPNRLNMASMMNPTYAGPMIDGKIVAETPEQALMAGHAMKIPRDRGGQQQRHRILLCQEHG